MLHTGPNREKEGQNPRASNTKEKMGRKEVLTLLLVSITIHATQGKEGVWYTHALTRTGHVGEIVNFQNFTVVYDVQQIKNTINGVKLDIAAALDHIADVKQAKEKLSREIIDLGFRRIKGKYYRLERKIVTEAGKGALCKSDLPAVLFAPVSREEIDAIKLELRSELNTNTQRPHKFLYLPWELKEIKVPALYTTTSGTPARQSGTAASSTQAPSTATAGQVTTIEPDVTTIMGITEQVFVLPNGTVVAYPVNPRAVSGIPVIYNLDTGRISYNSPTAETSILCVLTDMTLEKNYKQIEAVLDSFKVDLKDRSDYLHDLGQEVSETLSSAKESPDDRATGSMVLEGIQML